ncbi:MAG: type 1 glutamine amidotransferase domain-containing protein [Kofleriaceae bacterium]|nr:type 1 glutamine amidotransferase domain-containing protein [Kofleriaceae bacterium]
MARIAFVLGNDFEDSEFRIPYDLLSASGHQIDLVGIEAGKTVVGKHGKEQVELEVTVEDADPNIYDALYIPGGYSPDHLRTDAAMVDFTEQMADRGKPIAAICHGPSLLIEADVVRGKVLTSWPSIKTDLRNAGAKWVDNEVVVDGQLITSRKPADLAVFTRTIDLQLGTRPEAISRAGKPHAHPRH